MQNLSHNTPDGIVIFSHTQSYLLAIFHLLRVCVLRVLGTLVCAVELYKTQHKKINK